MKVKRIVVAVCVGLTVGLVNVCVNLYFSPEPRHLFIIPVLMLAGGGIYVATRKEGVYAFLGEEDPPVAEYIEPLPDLITTELPACAYVYIESVILAMRYRRSVRAKVEAELITHFQDAMKDCQSAGDRKDVAEGIVAEFGEPRLLARLIRRGKKRCRPLWRKAADLALQVSALMVILYFVYTVWFMLGRPTIDVDYLAILNEKNRSGVTDENNARLNYDRAKELYVEPDTTIKEEINGGGFWGRAHNDDYEAITKAQRKAISKWLKQNEPTWRQCVAASRKQYYYAEYEYTEPDDEKWLINLVSPMDVQLMAVDLRNLGLWRARTGIERGQTEQAIEDCLVLLGISRNLREKPLEIVNHMVGILIDKTVHTALLQIIDQPGMSASDLQDLQQQLSNMHPQGYPDFNVEGIRTMFLDTVQRIFTKGGPGGGHLIPGRLVAYHNRLMYAGSSKESPSLAGAVTICLAHAGRDETIAKYDEVFGRANHPLVTMTPYQRYSIGDSVSGHPELMKPKYHLIQQYGVPLPIGRFDSRYEAKSVYEAVVTVIAIKRYRLEKGEFPEDLDRLIQSGFLKGLPDDPFGEGPLRYARRGDDFILYSLGHDFDDDGGTPGVDTEDRPNLYSGTYFGGDAVFWPPDFYGW